MAPRLFDVLGKPGFARTLGAMWRRYAKDHVFGLISTNVILGILITEKVDLWRYNCGAASSARMTDFVGRTPFYLASGNSIFIYQVNLEKHPVHCKRSTVLIATAAVVTRLVVGNDRRMRTVAPGRGCFP